MDPISKAEVRLAIKQLNYGKAAWVDSVQLELLKTADSTDQHLTRVFNMVWQHWKIGIIITLPEKGNLT